MKTNYSITELETIQRECKMIYDSRSEQIRESIYQIKEFCCYISIKKELGEVTAYRVAQNSLVLHLNR